MAPYSLNQSGHMLRMAKLWRKGDEKSVTLDSEESCEREVGKEKLKI